MKDLADLREYKCPACGGAMEFDSGSQKMKCPYCDTEMSIEDYEKFVMEQEEAKKAREAAKKAQEKADENTEGPGTEKAAWTQEELDDMVIYSCESCGGEITADKNTGATTCPYCGNRVVFKGQFEDGLKPDYIIPFKLNKKEAKAAYEKHLATKMFVPSVFKKENHIDEIVGIYVPFWIFDMVSQGSASYDAERTKSWTSGDIKYIEHNIYEVEREGRMSFANIPEDASRKMADDLMESLEPYDFKTAVPFKAAYMAGYVADRYDVDVPECEERARKRAEQSLRSALRQTVKGYSSVEPKGDSVSVTSTGHKYALYPVWILNTTWKDQKFIFAMNGQSGKMIGDLPIDRKAYLRFVGIRGVFLSVIAYVLLTIYAML